MSNIFSKHPKSLYWITLSTLLEKFSYYGVRGIIVLYMIGETIGLERMEAITIYGWMAGLLFAPKLLGALLGDLLKRNKGIWIIGGILQALGCFIIAIPNEYTMYWGIGFYILGSGLLFANVTATMGQQYAEDKELAEAGFTLYYLSVNLGAALGILCIGLLFEFVSNALAFVVGGVIALISISIPLLNDLKRNKAAIFKSSLVSRSFYVISAALISTLFWVVFEFGYSGVGSVQVAIMDDTTNDIDNYNFFTNLNSIALLILCLILFCLLSIKTISSSLKITLGLFLGAVSYYVLYSINLEIMGKDMVSSALFGLLLLSLAEVLIAPSVNVVIVKYVNKRYLAIAFVLVSAILYFANYMMSLISNYTSDFKPKDFTQISMVILVCASLCVGIGYVVRRLIRNSDDETNHNGTIV